MAAALLVLPVTARADPGVWDVATPGPELGISIGVHALMTGLLITLATEWVASQSVASVAPLGGYHGIPNGGLIALAATSSLLLPVLSGTSIYALQRTNRVWRVQPGLIFAAGVVPEAIAQIYYATALKGYTVQGGLTAPNLLPKLVGAQVAAIIVTPVVQVIAAHLLREPDPDR